MVRGTRCVLGRNMLALRAQWHQLPARQLVAESGRFVRGEYPSVQVPSATGRSRVGERGLCALGAGGWLVQQYRVERWPAHCQTVSACDRALRVEQVAGIQIDCADGASFVEFGA